MSEGIFSSIPQEFCVLRRNTPNRPYTSDLSKHQKTHFVLCEEKVQVSNTKNTGSEKQMTHQTNCSNFFSKTVGHSLDSVQASCSRAP